MNSIFRKAAVAATVAICTLATSASAVTYSNVIAEFDDADDLLRLAGDITTTNNPTFNDLVFDWDGALNGFDFTSSVLLSSNIGGVLSAPAGGVSGGAFAITGIPGAPLSPVLSFDLLISIPTAGAAFLTEAIDFAVCQSCAPNFTGGEIVQNVITPVAADLTVPAAVPLPASLPILAGALGGLGLLRRRKTASTRKA